MLYMKGVPEFPQCGFSSLAVRVLGAYSKFSYFCSLDSEHFQLFYMLVKLIVVSVLIDINRGNGHHMSNAIGYLMLSL